MSTSPEYPDLPWVPPRSWTPGRPASPRVVVIHTTEGHEGYTAAEDGAAYDQRRTDGTSTHYFHDADSTVQCVQTRDQAHHALRHGNQIGIGHELCGTARQSDAQWDDAVSIGTLHQAARQVARDCHRWGIPVVKLTADQVRAGGRGLCGHIDITDAFPEDHGTHWDPGPHFPWADFLELVRAELGDAAPSNPAPSPAPAPDWRREIISKMDVINLAGVTGNSRTWVRGADVKRLQGLLLADGYGPQGLVDRHGRPDGVGGPGTRSYLGAAQRRHHTGRPSAPSVPDYVAGRGTWGALAGV